MAGNASIQVAGVTELTHSLEQWAGEVRAPRQLWSAVSRDVIGPAIEDRFAKQGPGWSPLSPQYAAWKAKHYPGQPILVQTGAMRAALTNYAGPTYSVSGNALSIGVQVPYFAYHQQGTKRLPARPMLVLAAISQPIHDYLDSWLTRKAGEYGLKAG